MRRSCDICGREYDARRSDSRMCSAACRQRRSRGAEPPPAEETPLLIATRQELEAAGKLETMLGQQAWPWPLACRELRPSAASPPCLASCGS